MISTLDFNTYVENRIKFYSKLNSFKVDKALLSAPIVIDSSFIRRLNSNFQDIVERRLKNEKFNKKSNLEYKERIRNVFPELVPILDHKDPAIYWFTINDPSGNVSEEIINEYSIIKKSGSGWWTKVDSKRKVITTDCLYLGKVEGALVNRFIQHIGIGHDFTTALKLQRWMGKIDKLQLTYQFLRVDSKMKPFLSDIEKVMWEKSNPLLGQKPRF
jgi:hypothetical protein